MGCKFDSILHILLFLIAIKAETYDVMIRTDRHISVVDSKFLSFTIDPKYLFSSSEKYKSKECLCMASSLAPAYIRVAGPSTSRLTFKNSSIIIDDEQIGMGLHTFSEESDEHPSLTVSQSEWSGFTRWAKTTGFEVVFALNNHQKTGSMWDANTALSMLTAAEKQHLGDMFWQLGYECTNQSIEEYLNDLETLRVIIETFPSGKSGRWKVVAGDVTNCLQAHSKSDFNDYVITSNDMMDAIFLDGNSSSYELSLMSPRAHAKLLQHLSRSATPLWVSQRAQQRPLPSAADRLLALGEAAASGFSVLFQELREDELCEPSLSFYMWLLFKQLVGARALLVRPATLFAHCAALRGLPAPGALTLYGTNRRRRPLVYSLNVTHAGDVLQYVLGHDRSGNIIVNGRTMHLDGDIKPVIRRARAHETVQLSLPPRSFGFWVVANARVEACYEETTRNNEADEVNDNEDNFIKMKRSIDETEVSTSEEIVHMPEENYSWEKHVPIGRIDDINYELRKLHQKINKKINIKRVKRETCEDDNYRHKKYRTRHNLKSRRNYEKSLGDILLGKLSKLSKHSIGNKKHKLSRLRGVKSSPIGRSARKISDENQAKTEGNDVQKRVYTKNNEVTNTLKDNPGDSDDIKIRDRRSVSRYKKHEEDEEDSAENEIENSKEKFNIGKIFNKLKKLSELPIEIQNTEDQEEYKENGPEDGIVLKTKLSEDSATIDITEKSHTGLLKSTLQDILSLLADLNKNVNRFWTAITIFE